MFAVQMFALADEAVPLTRTANIGCPRLGTGPRDREGEGFATVNIGPYSIRHFAFGFRRTCLVDVGQGVGLFFVCLRGIRFELFLGKDGLLY